MIRLTKEEKHSIYDCLTWWAEHNRERYATEHPRKLQWQTELAIHEARKGPLSAPDCCTQPKKLKGRCRGCWFAGDPTQYDSGGCLMGPGADPEERKKARWCYDEARKGRRYLGQELWSADPED